MASNGDIVNKLDEVLERLTRLEERLASLGVGQFNGVLTAETVNIAQGMVEISESEIPGLIINAGAVEISSDIESVQIDAKGKVDINGNVAESHVF